MSVHSLKKKRFEKQGKLYAQCPSCGGFSFGLIIDPAKAESENMFMYVTDVECLNDECQLSSQTGDGTEYDIVFRPE